MVINSATDFHHLSVKEKKEKRKNLIYLDAMVNKRQLKTVGNLKLGKNMAQMVLYGVG
jgi:hypothetical protein